MVQSKLGRNNRFHFRVTEFEFSLGPMEIVHFGLRERGLETGIYFCLYVSVQRRGPTRWNTEDDGFFGQVDKYSKSPTYEQVQFLERVRKSNKVSLGTHLTQSAIQYCNRFIILFSQIIHKEQTQKIKKTFLILQYSFHCYCLALPSSTSYITSAFMLTSGHPGPEIKLLYSIQYCTVKYTKAQPLVEDERT